MKLIVKSDDYGFTHGVTDGVVDGIVNGIIRNTGLFANMPSASYAIQRLKGCPPICLGIDINVVSGPCAADPALLPHLVDEKGYFIRSTKKMKDPVYQRESDNEELWPMEECCIETDAQIKKFIELTGKKPDYITGHSITSHAFSYAKALKKMAEKHEIPFVKDLLIDYNVKKLRNVTVKPFTMEAQLHANAEEEALSQLEANENEKIVMLSGHCGFVDEELLQYSTYSIIRAKDHKMYTSLKIKKWLEEHQVELITFNDLIHEKKKD